MTPKTTVIMPVYNGERYLREAIESILTQTFTDFEFIIIDDGSTDNTWNILREYQDSRIQLIRNEKNIGLTKSLNKAISMSKGTYIARMDADDISYPERFDKQVNFLDQHHNIDVLGTNLVRIGPCGNILDNQPKPYPTSPEVIGWMIYVRNCIQHPTVMLRQNVYEKTGGYDVRLAIAQDYDLWMRASLDFNLCNLPDVLLKYRCHPENVSNRHKNFQEKATDEIVLKNLSWFLKRTVDNGVYRSIDIYKKHRNHDVAIRIGNLFSLLLQECLCDPNLSTGEKRLLQETIIDRLLALANTHLKRPAVALRLLGRALVINKNSTFRALLNIKRREH